MVPRSVQVVDDVVENSNKSSSNQRFIPYKVLTGKGITLNAHDSTVHEDHASKVKHFIMTNEKHMICFSETRFDSKYLHIDESNITLKTNKMFSNKFAEVVLFSMLFQFYKGRIFL